MSGTWILVADQARARIFHGEGDSRLHEVETLLNPDARINEQDIVSDRPGRAFDSIGSGRHSMGSPVDPKEEEAIRFAKELCTHMDELRNKHSMDKVYVMAPPHFLGLLREAMHAPLKALVAGEVNHDLTEHSVADIRAHLPEQL